MKVYPDCSEEIEDEEDYSSDFEVEPVRTLEVDFDFDDSE